MEIKTQELLSKYISSLTLVESCVFNTPVQHPVLKNIFKNASKKKTKNQGRPDRIYFDGESLFVFECTPSNIEKAVCDLKDYKQLISVPDEIKTFYCAFVGTEETNQDRKWFDSEMNVVNENIILNHMRVKHQSVENKGTMDDVKKIVHKIHDAIRNKTKLNDSDKPLFICAVLLALEDESFLKMISLFPNEDPKLCIVDLILTILKKISNDEDFVISFSFLKEHLNNETLFYFCNLIQHDIKSKPFHGDLLNIFYNEFVKYQNTDSKSLGIVLTPEHIVLFMTRILQLNQNDIFLDLCSGSGSFVCSSLSEHVKKIYAVEFQSKLYSLLKANMILRHANNAILYHKSCFDVDFSDCNITKSAINPPYGMKSPEKELDFLMKQLESVEENGLVTAIVPIGCFNNSKTNNKIKEKICKISKIKSLIRCNKKLFSEQASVETCIILLEKNKNGYENDDLTCLVNYEDDGVFAKIRNGKIRDETFVKKFEKAVQDVSRSENKKHLGINSDWMNQDIVVDKYVSRYEFKIEQEIKEHEKKMKQLTEQLSLKKKEDLITYSREKTFLIGELFHVVKKPLVPYSSSEDEKIAIVCASKVNDGIKDYGTITEKTFSGNLLVLVTGGDGGAGLCHYHSKPFNITSSTCALIPKKFKIPNEMIGRFLARLLSKYKIKYSHAFQWNRTRIENDTITLPVDAQQNIDFSVIQSFL